MPLVHLRLPFRVVGSRVHSVPQNTITLTCSELLCPLSPVNVTANTRILVQPSEGNFDECNFAVGELLRGKVLISRVTGHVPYQDST